MINAVLFQPLKRFAQRGLLLAMVASGLVGVAQAQTTQAPAKPAAQCPAMPTQPTPEKIQQLMGAAKDRGFMWTIEKDGVTSYLYGTMHVNKEEWLFPGKQIMAALMKSGTIALELDPMDQANLAVLMAPEKLGINKFALPPALAARVKTKAEQVCLHEQAYTGAHPVMQGIMLSMFDARFLGLEAAYGVEIFLAGFARGTQKPVASLETAELQLKALMTGTQEEQIQGIEKALDQLDQGTGRRLLGRMANAWGSSDFAEFEKYEQWCDCLNTATERAAYKRINDDRNPGLADGIDALHKKGKPAFFAIGSLHMVGDKALPKLLAAKGYKVERVKFE